MPDQEMGEPARPSRRDRSPTLVDAMILIAAIAAGLMIVKETWNQKIDLELIDKNEDWFDFLEEARRVITLCMTSFLMTLTPATLLLRRRRTGASARRLFREYGTIACIVAVCLLPFSLRWPIEREPPTSLSEFFTWFLKSCLVEMTESSISYCGPAVIGAWLAMKLGRTGRVGGWVDRLGIVLGAAWSILLLLDVALWLVEFYRTFFVYEFGTIFVPFHR